MVFPWSKTEPAEREQTPAPAPDRTENLGETGELIAALGRVGALVAAASEKILAGLASHQRQAAASASSADFLPAPVQSVEAALASLREQVAGATEDIRRLQDRLDRGLEHLAHLLAPGANVGDQGSLPMSDWERAILGDELAGQPKLAFQRHQLLSGVLEGNAAACALAGQLLVFRSAPGERLPPLLKEIGEAYYRWQPKIQPGNSPFEESLAGWLQRTCEAAGLRNAIELVHPGERFDAARHNASSRGVEVTEVMGWVVLRDNGKVYTKANVAVR